MTQDIETEITDFQVIINKYESLVQELTQELQYVKSEHDSLKSKLSTVVVENKQLTQQLGGLISKKDRGIISEQADLVENLRLQIQSLLTEKDYITKLWQNTIKTVEVLEGELGVFQAGAQNFVSKKDFTKMKESYEEKITALEEKLNIAERKREETPRLAYQELGFNVPRVELNLENQTGALRIVKNLEEEVLALQNRLQESEKTRNKLQKSLQQKETIILDLSKKNNQYRDKVTEAVQVVEAALNEKDAALFREKEAKVEIEKVSQELTDIMNETEEKIKKEVAVVKLEYARKLEDLHMELKQSQEELKMKNLEIEKISTKCELLESQIERFQKGNVDENCSSKLLILEKNLESTFQKLLVSEKQNIQLSSEKLTMKNDIEQMADHYERTLKTKEVERLTLQSRINQLQVNLDETNTTLSSIKEQFESLKVDKIDAEKQLRLQIEQQEHAATRKLTDKISEIADNYSEKVKQLQLQLESKDKLNKKWSSETKTIVENLEQLVSNMKVELHKVKKDNRKLQHELQDSQNKFQHYKMFLQIISKDVDDISHKTFQSTDPG